MAIIHFSLFVILCLGVHRSSSEILQRQKRNWIIDSFSIDEGYDGKYPYKLDVVKVQNKHTQFAISGQGVDLEPKGILQIDKITGEVTVHGPVDYEEYSVLKCTFQAMDVERQIVDTELGIEILILDANDNPPAFDQQVYRSTIDESTMQGTKVTIIRATDRDSSENNTKISFSILSVTPETSQDLEFYLIQSASTQTAAVSFHGCLDHETTDEYTIIVEAKDNGKKPLSSTSTVIITINDGNNHIPEIIGLTGPGKVKEGQQNVLISRLQIKDADTKGTKAWKAQYKIHGDTHGNFKISRDSETNDGLLYVAKPLDFEDSPLKNVTISMENEIASHTCQVISRSTTAAWKVQTSSGIMVSSVGTGGQISGTTISGGTITGTSITSNTISGGSNSGASASGGIVKALGISAYVVTVTVENVNEAPIFDQPNLQFSLSEFVKVGHYLVTMTAKDPDVNSATTFKYTIGHDQAGWFAVDSVTGKVTLAKNIDRESTFVQNNIYKVIIHAIDNGQPHMTGSATISIKVLDENDNTPFLNKSTIDMCQSNGHSMANITAVDLDEHPYGGPFIFKLLGDVEGKWRFEPSQGYSVNLVKESTVHSGIFDLLVQVSDLQQETAVHNLTVTVCNCINTAEPKCYIRTPQRPKAGAGLLVLIFFSILLIAGLLLLAFVVSCKKRTIPFTQEPMQRLIESNIEKPGTDCQVIYEGKNNGLQIIKSNEVSQGNSNTLTTLTEQQRRDYLQWLIKSNEVSQGNSNTLTITEQQRRDYLQWLIKSNEVSQGNSNTLTITEQQRRDYLQWLKLQKTMDLEIGGSQEHWRKFLLEQQQHNEFARGNSMRWTMGGLSTMRTKYQDKYVRQMWAAQCSAENEIAVHREILLKVLNEAQHTLEAPGVELGDYAPHVYAEEGDIETIYELDAISIADSSFNLDLDLNLNYKFNTLASICMPCESTAYSANNYYVLETLNTATEIQTESQSTNMNTQLLSTNCIFDQVINPTF